MFFFFHYQRALCRAGKFPKKTQPEIFAKLAEESADGYIQLPTLLINRVPSVCYSNKSNASAEPEAVAHTHGVFVKNTEPVGLCVCVGGGHKTVCGSEGKK